MPKMYFTSYDDACYTKKYWKAYMLENNLESMELFEAEREKVDDYFWCSEFMEIGEKNDSQCGKNCQSYKPRNGKSGNCCFKKQFYSETDKKIILVNKNNKK